VPSALKDYVSPGQLHGVVHEYTKFSTVLGCLLIVDGKPVVAQVGSFQSISFSKDAHNVDGVIVVNAIGDAAMIPAGAPLGGLLTNSDVTAASDPISVGNATLQLAELDDGTCYAAIKPDAATPWTVTEPATAPRLLAVFLGLQQIGRPDGTKCHFDPPHTAVTFTSTGIDGVDDTLAAAAQTATRCPAPATLEAAGLAAPPSP
jgi:hypothetical protein